MQSIGGRKYILVMVDDFSIFGWVAFLYAKPDALANFISVEQRGDVDDAFEPLDFGVCYAMFAAYGLYLC